MSSELSDGYIGFAATDDGSTLTPVSFYDVFCAIL